MSLADLHAQTTVSLPTLRKAIQELSNNRWIRVIGQAEANGGRPAMLFGLDESYYAVIGVQLQLPGIRLITSDLSGHVLHSTDSFKQMKPNPEEVTKAIIEYIHKIQAKMPYRSILGIGIAAPGFTNPETGTIISIGRVSGWDKFPICVRLQSEVHLPAQIANDVDCMAFAEFQYARKSFVNNLAYVGFDEGVKVSLFLNGELYKGSLGNAGLIISRFLNVDDLDIPHEKQQKMLTISGLNHIFEAAVQQLPEEEQRAYLPILQRDNRARLEHIFGDIKPDDPIYQRIMSQLTDILAAAIANIIYIIQPDEIVIGGVLGYISKDAFITLRTKIRQHLPTLFSNQVKIEQARLLSPNVSALGATFHFLENYLSVRNFELSPENYQT